MKNLIISITIISISILPFTVGAQITKPINEPEENTESTEKTKETRTFFTLQNFNGFGQEKLAQNYKKSELFTGLKLKIGFGEEWIQGFVFGSLEANREKGVDYTPAGPPETWVETQPVVEAGLGFKVDFPFNYKERFGVVLEFESNMLEMIEDRYPVPTFTPGLFLRKNNFRFVIANTFNITKDGQLNIFGSLEYEF